MADDYYLIAHEEHAQQCRGHSGAVGLGLAAGLVGELVLSHHVTVVAGGLYPTGLDQDAPPDALLREVWRLVADPRQDRDLRTWLRFLATDAITDVRHRMTQTRVLVPVASRGLVGKRRIQHLPVDRTTAAWPGIRLAGALSRHQQMTTADGLLAGLVQATGLTRHVLWDDEHHAPGHAYLAQLRTLLPDPLAALVAVTEVAVGEQVLTRHG